MKKNDKLVFARGYGMASQARLAKNLLKKYGVDSLIQATTVGGVMLGSGTDAGPHAVFVKKEDFEKAKEILGEE